MIYLVTQLVNKILCGDHPKAKTQIIRLSTPYGLVVAAIVPTIVAGLIGYAILGLRGHYFAICTLGLGVAAGEISGGIEIIGAGQGFTTPPFPEVGDLEARGEFFYFLSFLVLVLPIV